MDDELRLHVELETERLQAGGLSPQAARRQALRDFGGIEQIKEISRDVRGTTSVDAVLRDVRQGARRLIRDWRFTVAAVLILGLGIGATTAVFSVVNAVLFRGQIVDTDRLVDLYQNAGDGGSTAGTSYPAYQDMAAYTDVFASTAAASMPDSATFRDGNGGLRPAVVEYATATYLTTLGLRPSLGRWFEESEERVGAALVAVVGHGTWIRKFGADPSVIGRTIRILGTPVTIVGVGPAGHNATLPIGVVHGLLASHPGHRDAGRSCRVRWSADLRSPSSSSRRVYGTASPCRRHGRRWTSWADGWPRSSPRRIRARASR